MSEVVNPAGTVSATTLTSFTSAEAATGTNGAMERGNIQELGARTRFLDTTGKGGELTWTAPTLLNSWVNFGGAHQTAGFYKDLVSGRVYLRGLIKSGTTTTTTTLFVLPSGYRPTATEIIVSTSNDAVVTIAIDTSGNVTLNSAANATYLSLNNLSFRIV